MVSLTFQAAGISCKPFVSDATQLQCHAWSRPAPLLVHYLFYDRCYSISRHTPQIPFAVVALLGSLVLEGSDVLGLKKIALPGVLIHYGTSLASFSLSGPRVKRACWN